MAMERTSTAILGVTVAAIAMVALVTAALVTNRTLPNTGNVKSIGVDVFWDSGCTNTTSSINWGLVGPGESKSLTVYVRNSGTASELLSMTTGNWSSSAAQSKISLSWNREGYSLANGTTPVQAILTLSVNQTITGVVQFSFDITITGTAS